MKFKALKDIEKCPIIKKGSQRLKKGQVIEIETNDQPYFPFVDCLLDGYLKLISFKEYQRGDFVYILERFLDEYFYLYILPTFPEVKKRMQNLVAEGSPASTIGVQANKYNANFLLSKARLKKFERFVDKKALYSVKHKKGLLFPVDLGKLKARLDERKRREAEKEVIQLKKKLASTTLHRQARGYLKTTASLVGRDTSGQKSLFEIPHFDTATNLDLNKKVVSKTTAITGNHLLALWQANKDDKNIYKITNLSEVARQLNIKPEELKIYLIYLGGYQRPISQLEIIKEQGKKDKRILSIYHDKLFYIKFNIRLKDDERNEDFNNDARVGTGYVNFIKNRDIESVEVTPALSLQKELEGQGLGNVLVDNNFVAFSLDLSDLAYKIFCFSSSNKPNFKIGFKKLVDQKYLNLDEQVKGTYNKAGKKIKKGQGKARILQRIKDSLDELKMKKHLTKWSYNEQTGFFCWTYSDEVIKHKELLKEKGGHLELRH